MPKNETVPAQQCPKSFQMFFVFFYGQFLSKNLENDKLVSKEHRFRKKRCSSCGLQAGVELVFDEGI